MPGDVWGELNKIGPLGEGELQFWELSSLLGSDKTFCLNFNSQDHESSVWDSNFRFHRKLVQIILGYDLEEHNLIPKLFISPWKIGTGEGHNQTEHIFFDLNF